jgi:hypothetical protein
MVRFLILSDGATFVTAYYRQFHFLPIVVSI